MKYLLIALLLASCTKSEPPTICYKIESYIVKKTAPATYEVTAVNYPLRKFIFYQTKHLPIIGNKICKPINESYE